MNKSSKSAAPLPDRVRELRTRLAHHIASFVGHQENLASEIRGLRRCTRKVPSDSEAP